MSSGKCPHEHSIILLCCGHTSDVRGGSLSTSCVNLLCNFCYNKHTLSFSIEGNPAYRCHWHTMFGDIYGCHDGVHRARNTAKPSQTMTWPQCQQCAGRRPSLCEPKETYTPTSTSLLCKALAQVLSTQGKFSDPLTLPLSINSLRLIPPTLDTC